MHPIMANIILYLDTRSVDHRNTSAIKVVISHKGRTALITSGFRVKADQWDASLQAVIGHPRAKSWNNILTAMIYNVREELFKLRREIDGISATDLKHKLAPLITGAEEQPEAPRDFLIPLMKNFATNKQKTRTRELYETTIRRLREFDADIDGIRLSAINKSWLISFDNFLSLTSPSPNARNIHLRNIRAVFNAAIDDEITTHYPFRKFALKSAPTAKRSLTARQLRAIISEPLPPHLAAYRDIFTLIFMLIGINLVDLCNLDKIIDNRIEYTRAKTGRFYSIKVEPEAAEIIQRHRGRYHLIDIGDRYDNYRNYTIRINAALKRIGNPPVCSELSTYWARHSWATIAAELDIPKETIAAALGHGGNSVTDIYIRFDDRKIDEANRRVLDYVLYNKK